MDDLHGCGERARIERLRAHLSETVKLKEFDIHDLGASYTHLKRGRVLTNLGTRITPNTKYGRAATAAMALTGCKAAPTPSVAGALRDDGEDPYLDDDKISTYRCVTGTLAYAGIDRRDLQFELNLLSRQMKQPRESGWALAKRVCRYICGTEDAYVWLPRPRESDYDYGVCVLDVWSDSDWAGDRRDRRSQSSIVLEIDGCPAFGASRRQAIIAGSSAEAEFYAAAGALSEAMLLRECLLFAGFAVETRLFMDASAGRAICQREGVGRIRHMSVRVLWVQQLVKRKVVQVMTTTSEGNKADLGTKSHPKARLCRLRIMNGIRTLGPEAEEEEQLAQDLVQAVAEKPSATQVLAAVAAAFLGARAERQH